MMDSEWKPSIKEINGVNLANYFPHQRSYNSIVYIHKKFLDDYKSPEVKKEKVKPVKKKKSKIDKSQQFNTEKTETLNDKTYKISNNDSVLEQTIRFAKNLVPSVIPPTDDKPLVFYTIKTTKKRRTKDKQTQDTTSFEHHPPTYDKPDSKKVIETYRKVRKESFSVRESLTHSSSNTLDDLNINQSLCCTFSEQSEKKHHKKDKSYNKKHDERQKFAVSESFQALAENTSDSKIKIHLMNEKEKHFLSDSIKAPILTAIRECISELSNCNPNTDMATVQKILKCNTGKLDTIIEKIACIEKKLDSYTVDNRKETRASENKVQSKVSKAKASALEELEEDFIESKEDYSSEEELHQELLYRRSKSIATDLVTEDKSGENVTSIGGGEVPGGLKDASIGGIKPDRPNRIPARFCWTDAARK